MARDGARADMVYQLHGSRSKDVVIISTNKVATERDGSGQICKIFRRRNPWNVSTVYWVTEQV